MGKIDKLIDYIWKRDSYEAKLILQENPELVNFKYNENGNTIFHFAVNSCFYDLVRFMLGISCLDIDPFVKLRFAVVYRNIEVVNSM